MTKDRSDSDVSITDITAHPRHPSNTSAEDECRKCGGPMTLRPQAPYPTLIQVLFGVSFLALFVMWNKIEEPIVMWVWTLVQVILGVLLAKGRQAARRRVLRCVRCGAALR